MHFIITLFDQYHDDKNVIYNLFGILRNIPVNLYEKFKTEDKETCLCWVISILSTHCEKSQYICEDGIVIIYMLIIEEKVRLLSYSTLINILFSLMENFKWED